MQHDELIWQVIGHSHCSYRSQLGKERAFCRNEYNLNGLCSRSTCPLANSRYATIREHEGKVYLYMKTIERAHSPLNLWERVLLSKNYTTALEQIDELLQHWPQYIIHKSKQRLTKIVQYLIRMKTLAAETTTTTLVAVDKKEERLDAIREQKALRAAKIENTIEKELLERLKQGAYGEIYNFPETAYTSVLNEAEKELEEDDEETEKTKSKTKKRDRDSDDDGNEEDEDEEEYEEEEEEEEEDDYDDGPGLAEFIAAEDSDESDEEDEDNDYPSTEIVSGNLDLDDEENEEYSALKRSDDDDDDDDIEDNTGNARSNSSSGASGSSSSKGGKPNKKRRKGLPKVEKEDEDNLQAQIRSLAQEAATAQSKKGNGKGNKKSVRFTPDTTTLSSASKNQKTTQAINQLSTLLQKQKARPHVSVEYEYEEEQAPKQRVSSATTTSSSSSSSGRGGGRR